MLLLGCRWPAGAPRAPSLPGPAPALSRALSAFASGRVGRRNWSNVLRLNGCLDSPRTFCRHRDSPYSMHLHGLYSSKLKRP